MLIIRDTGYKKRSSVIEGTWYISFVKKFINRRILQIQKEYMANKILIYCIVHYKFEYNIILNFTIINYLRKLTLFVWVLYTLWFCVPLIVLLLIHCLIIVKSVLLIQTKKYLCQINCKEMLYIIWENMRK